MAAFCIHCGSPISDGAAFCTNCGAAQAQHAPPAQQPPQQYQQPYAQPAQPQYQQQPAYYQQATPPPKKSRKGLFITLGVLGGLLVCGALGVGALLLFSGGGGDNGDWTAWQPTRSQQRVVAEFGYPETFSVYFGVDPNDQPAANGELPIHRLEVWDYYSLGSRFTFKDGEATGVYDAPAAPAGTEFPLLRPDEFAVGMSLQDVTDVIGVLPTEGADIAPDIIEGLEVYVFEGQVSASFDQGRLVGVETVPVSIEGGV